MLMNLCDFVRNKGQINDNCKIYLSPIERVLWDWCNFPVNLYSIVVASMEQL